jgi:hypothetical protein
VERDGLCDGATLEALSTVAPGGHRPLLSSLHCASVRTVFVASSVVLAVAAGCRGQGSEGADSRGQGSEPALTAAGAENVAKKMRVQEAPSQGDVDAIVRGGLAEATRGKRRLVVYVGATWCEPCQRFHQAAERGELDATFPDVDLLSFDVDRDGTRLASAGYVSKLIPLLALPAPDGRASGKQVEGGIKGAGAVVYMTRRLRQMLSE